MQNEFHWDEVRFPDGLAVSVLAVGLALSTASSLILLSLAPQTLDDFLESAHLAVINGSAPEEVQMKRREAKLAGEDFEDGVTAAITAKIYDGPSVKDTARTTIEAAVEPTVEANVKMTNPVRRAHSYVPLSCHRR